MKTFKLASLSCLLFFSSFIACNTEEYTSIAGEWEQIWYNPFLNNMPQPSWAISIDTDSVTIVLTGSSIETPTHETHKFATNIDSNTIYIALDSGRETTLKYRVNKSFDTMSIKFLDHSSRAFKRIE